MTSNPILVALNEFPLDREAVEEALSDIDAYQRNGEPMSDLLIGSVGFPGNYGDVESWRVRNDAYLNDARAALLTVLFAPPVSAVPMNCGKCGKPMHAHRYTGFLIHDGGWRRCVSHI